MHLKVRMIYYFKNWAMRNFYLL